MKRTILISLAAGIAIVPAMIGVAFASNGHGAEDTRTTPSASASSTADDRNRGADDSATSSPTSSVPTASRTVDDRDRGRGSDDATTSSAPTKSATSPATSRTSTAKTTVDDKGHGVEAGDDSGGHGGRSGKN